MCAYSSQSYFLKRLYVFPFFLPFLELFLLF
jgi:hypothetical protein